MSFFMIFCEVVAFFCVIPDLLEKIEETLISHAFASFMHDNGQPFYLVMPKEGSACCPSI